MLGTRYGPVVGLPDAFCKNTDHFVNSARSKLCCYNQSSQPVVCSPKKPDLVPKKTQEKADRGFETYTRKTCITKHKINIKTRQKHRYNTVSIFRSIFFPRKYTVVNFFLSLTSITFRATVKSLQYSVHPAWLQTLVSRDL